MVERSLSPSAARAVAQRPLVSVIVPAFDAEAHLAAAIDSALAQTYSPLEIVVVNDGSTDRTGEIARGFGDRIVCVEQENRGLAGARNAGLRAARGELVALLDADDAWLPERLERCVTVLVDRPEVGMVTTDAYVVEGTVLTDRRYYGGYQRYPWPDDGAQLDEIAQRNFLFVSVVFRRDLLDQCGTFDESLHRAEDYDLWTRFLLHGARAALVPEPLALYCVRPDSLSRARGAQWDAHLTILERHLPELRRRGVDGRAIDAYEIGRLLADRGERRRALEFFTMALRGHDVPLRVRARYAAGALGSLARRRSA